MRSDKFLSHPERFEDSPDTNCKMTHPQKLGTHLGGSYAGLDPIAMLGKVLKAMAAQGVRTQVRNMSMAKQFEGFKEVKVKDSVRYFSDKMKDPAVHAAAKVVPTSHLLYELYEVGVQLKAAGMLCMRLASS